MHNKMSIVLEGYGVRLRPVTVSDASFILKMRHLPHAVGKLGDLDLTVEQEESWLRENIQNPCDYFFIIESCVESYPDEMLGTIGVYDIDFAAKSAETGRSVTTQKPQAHLAARVLLIDFCFNTLGLERLNSCVVSTNKTMLSFYNQRLGLECKRIVKNGKTIGGKEVDMVYFELVREVWESKRIILINVLNRYLSTLKQQRTT